MASYCILGGTGFVGSRLIAHLANQGHRITVPTRDPERARHLRIQPSTRIIRADVQAPGTLAGLLGGSDAVINLIGILNESGRDGRGFRRAHVELMQTLITACESAGVSRLIQISALNAGAPQASSHYLRSKGEAEALLRAARLDWTILQPSVIYGPGDAFLNRFAGLLKLIPWAFTLPMPDTRFAPLHVDDLVLAIARTLQDPQTTHQTLQLYGAESFTLREIVQMIADTLGLARRIIGMSRGPVASPGGVDGLRARQAVLDRQLPLDAARQCRYGRRPATPRHQAAFADRKPGHRARRSRSAQPLRYLSSHGRPLMAAAVRSGPCRSIW